MRWAGPSSTLSYLIPPPAVTAPFLPFCVCVWMPNCRRCSESAVASTAGAQWSSGHPVCPACAVTTPPPPDRTGPQHHILAGAGWNDEPAPVLSCAALLCSALRCSLFSAAATKAPSFSIASWRPLRDFVSATSRPARESATAVQYTSHHPLHLPSHLRLLHPTCTARGLLSARTCRADLCSCLHLSPGRSSTRHWLLSTLPHRTRSVVQIETRHLCVGEPPSATSLTSIDFSLDPHPLPQHVAPSSRLPTERALRRPGIRILPKAS